MNRAPKAALLLLAAALLAGCWDKNELTVWGYVQAVALDAASDGKIRMTVQIYKPGSPEMQSAGTSSRYLDVESTSASVFTASKEIASRLGRKLQWSHMRALLIGEKLARSRDISEYLDFFSRSQGPRGSTRILIASGEARPYLLLKPLIESTIGQQLLTVADVSNDFLGSESSPTLLDLNILARSGSVKDLIPRLKMESSDADVAYIDALSVIRYPQGRIVGIVPFPLMPYVTMIRNEFRGGVVELPCREDGKNPADKDSVHINDARARLAVESRGGKPSLRIRLDLKVRIAELHCSRIVTKEDQRNFQNRMQQEVTDHIDEAMRYLTAGKMDVIHAGEQLQRHHPKLWRRWSEDWEEQFARSETKTDVNIVLTDTGMDMGEPFATEPARSD